MAETLFHTFNSQEDRRKYGGSAFIEMQFCVLPAETKIKNIVAGGKIHNWRNDSLHIYIDDDDLSARNTARFSIVEPMRTYKEEWSIYWASIIMRRNISTPLLKKFVRKNR